MLRALERAVFDPARLPPSAVTAVAIAPPIVAGLAFFQARAAIALLLALAVGGSLHLAARRLRVPTGESPALAATFAVALMGPVTSPISVTTIALLAGALELARARFVPGARIELGLAAFALAFVLVPDATSGFIQPGSGHALAEPIRLWFAFGGGGAAPIDPVRLYVGNVPGPMFATSLMAVVIGAAWLWFAGRLAVSVLLAFAAGAAVPVLLGRWNLGFHLDSGPTWFAVALVLGDRRRLPASYLARLLAGLAAGLLAVEPRTQGAGIEAVFLAVAALQAVIALVEGCGWLVRHRGDVGAGLRGMRGGRPRPGAHSRAA